MERQQILAKLQEVRGIIRQIADETDNPMLERCLRLADMNLHWAQWGLGEFSSFLPELEPHGSGRSPARP
ncbi:MAG: hypothetical protein HY652_02715 [Acidobacteria bacterium]|nr:hypothetical protein [Acidobacteriota bacterium]